MVHFPEQIDHGSQASRYLLTFVAVVLFSVISSAGREAAGESVPSPIESISAAGHDVAVVELLGSRSSAGASWRVLSVLAGSPPKEFVAHGVDFTGGPFEGRFVLAVSKLRKDPLFREQLVTDAEGYRVVDVVDFGPAILPWSAELERLIRSAGQGLVDSAPQEGLSDLECLIMGEAEGPRRLALLELDFRRAWALEVGGTTEAALRSVLEENPRGWEEKSLALSVARRLPEESGRVWWLPASRSILDGAPISMELASFEPAVVQTALLILADLGSATDAEMTAKFLSSNSPGVVREAAAAVRRLDCSVGLKRASERLQQAESLHAESKRILTEFLRVGCGQE